MVDRAKESDAFRVFPSVTGAKSSMDRKISVHSSKRTLNHRPFFSVKLVLTSVAEVRLEMVMMALYGPQQQIPPSG